MENKGVVYKVTHTESGKSYIGITTKSIGARKKDHLKKSAKGKSYEFHKAIATYGSEAFRWEQVDTAKSVDELASKEKEYILKYDCLENGYNLDVGGGIQKTIYQYDFKGTLINTFSSLQSAGNAVNAVKSAIGKACDGNSKSCKGYVWSYSSSFPAYLKDNRKKKVLQISFKGRVINRFNSVSEAAKQTGFNKTSIAKVCRGERRTCGDFYWRYL
ncbi:NUMOD1 domain-containing DNA-binding protein [Polaribacter aquimarinus]|uniref:Endonuclease n=1 Tax=Polaribacter aquimarinus TaxID=2100726 RepID=A0A2U2JA50_9FLAO|nr:NUMOD1 domain-containing DNA-binding protein [Polaribacter aquimarinus]PWG05220.1 endonuclease [Polaribacter aquimarinus]